LADSTFAFACNSRNAVTVASGCTIDYLAPGFEGDTLTAQASEYSLAGRTGIYDVHVTNQDGKPIAIFRGRSYRLKGMVVDAWRARRGAAEQAAALTKILVDWKYKRVGVKNVWRQSIDCRPRRDRTREQGRSATPATGAHGVVAQAC